MALVSGEDIIMSVISYISSKRVRQKSGDGFILDTISAKYPNINILPRGLSWEVDTQGPRIGVRPVYEHATAFFYGAAQIFSWSLAIEVDCLILRADGTPDVYAGLRALHSLKASLQQMFYEGVQVPLSIWGETGAFADAGSLTVRKPRTYPVSDTQFAIALSLDQISQPGD